MENSKTPQKSLWPYIAGLMAVISFMLGTMLDLRTIMSEKEHLEIVDTSSLGLGEQVIFQTAVPLEGSNEVNIRVKDYKFRFDIRNLSSNASFISEARLSSASSIGDGLAISGQFHPELTGEERGLFDRPDVLIEIAPDTVKRVELMTDFSLNVQDARCVDEATQYHKPKPVSYNTFIEFIGRCVPDKVRLQNERREGSDYHFEFYTLDGESVRASVNATL